MRNFICTFLLCAVAWGLSAQELSYLDLIGRLTDLERLAVLPDKGETCAQWSSYDRASKYDAATGKYVAWDANGDGGGFIRREGDSIVMAEMTGPGCIWRIWSAQPEGGHVKIYLDGAAEPAIDLPFRGYFDGKNAPFTGKALVHEAARGWNNYVPIPYQKSCKVVAEKGWGNYYHFGYTTYPVGTKVPTFRRNLSPAETAALDAADTALVHCGPAPNALSVPPLVVPAGRTVVAGRRAGPEAIHAITMQLKLPGTAEDRNILRELAIKITWDDETQPAVWCPVGDFFGTAAGANKYRSLPLGLADGGVWYCNWYMPFGKSAKIELVNDGKTDRSVILEVLTDPLNRPIESYARFHCKWHRDAFLPAEKDRQIDWPMLITQGRGRFVGVMQHIWNPKGGWWGEGDEKFFVDGEKFPSTFGTGSEDYFGYAWGDPKLFQNAFHNQTISQNNKGHISVNRWHITDNVPFQTSFEADIEKYYPNRRPCLFASTVYWYLAPGGKDPYEPVPVDQRVGYWDVPIVTNIPGAIEGETMKVLAKTGGKIETQELSDGEFSWSNDKQLFWTQGKPGDKLDVALPVKADGKFKMLLQFTKARDYAIVQVYLDGKKLGQPVDLYNNGVIPSGVMDFGIADLSAGEHKLTFEIVGANEKALKAYMVGLDYVKLEEAK